MSDASEPKKMFRPPFPTRPLSPQSTSPYPGGSESPAYGEPTPPQGFSLEPTSDYSSAYSAGSPPHGWNIGTQPPPATGNLPPSPFPIQGPSVAMPGNFPVPPNPPNQAQPGPVPPGRSLSYTRPLWPNQVPQESPPPAMWSPSGNQSSFQNAPVYPEQQQIQQLPFSPPERNYPYAAVPTIQPAPFSPDSNVPDQPTRPSEALPPTLNNPAPSSSSSSPQIRPQAGEEPEIKTATSKRRFYRRLRAYRNFSRLRTASHYSLRARMLMVALLFCLLAPLIVGTGEGINTYIIYQHARGGINHLLNLRNIFLTGNNHTAGLLDINKLKQASQEFAAAHDDFLNLNSDLNQDLTVGALSAFLPKQITTARALSKIGVDVTDMGQELVSTATVLAPALRSPLANDPTSTGPLITQSMLDRLDQSIVYILPRLDNVEQESHNLSLDSLPLISVKQRDEFQQVIQLLPTARADLSMAHNLKNAFSWILGVGQPRTFLVQTVDRAELRPAGGFTGQYGELQLNGGKLNPFTLKDIGALEDFNDNSPVLGNQPPAAYRSWWPFANWGLRDSNLSADFPTSAKMAMDLYKLELNKKVDGVIYFSPFLISRVLQVIGPVQITKYQDTVTAQNLEERLHYYQLNNVGIRKIKVLNHTPDAPDSDVRKLFTAEVARVLMDRVRHSPPDELLAIGKEMLHDLQTKDLQVYVDNPQVENLLTEYNSSSQMDTFTKHDGFMVVQANVNATKASQYTRTTLHDTVTLDAKGGATHLLQIRLAYNQDGPVYGMDTLRDYVRIYAPQNSQLLWGNGFEEPGFDAAGYYCGAGYGECPSPDIYQNGALLCPAGLDDAGVTPFLLDDPYSVKNHPFRNVGAPANTTTDMPGRAMFGGYVVIPKNCTATATLSWYVPPITQGSYSLLVQRQPSTIPELDLTLQTTPSSCGSYTKSGLHYDGMAGGPDMTFSLKMQPPSTNSSCYIQPPV